MSIFPACHAAGKPCLPALKSLSGHGTYRAIAVNKVPSHLSSMTRSLSAH